MSVTLQLAGAVLAAGDDLSPSNAGAVNLNLTLWSAIAGTVTPFLVAVVNQPRWSPLIRALLTVAVSLGIGAATAALEGRLDGTRWVTSALVVLTAAVGTYHTLWRNVAPKLEIETSPKSPATA